MRKLHEFALRAEAEREGEFRLWLVQVLFSQKIVRERRHSEREELFQIWTLADTAMHPADLRD